MISLDLGRRVTGLGFVGMTLSSAARLERFPGAYSGGGISPAADP